MSKIFSATAALIASAALVTGALAPAAMAKADPKRVQQEEVSTEKRYCVISENTGSRLRKKECRTRGEWIAQTGADPALEAAKK